MTPTATADQPLELARREGDGLEVVLVWFAGSGRLAVDVADSRNGAQFRLDADPERALDIYHHPYAYAAARGVRYRADAVALAA